MVTSRLLSLLKVVRIKPLAEVAGYPEVLPDILPARAERPIDDSK